MHLNQAANAGLRRRLARFFVGPFLVILSTPFLAGPGLPGDGGDPPMRPTLTAPSIAADGNYTVTWTTPTGTDYFDFREKLGSGSWNTIFSGGGLPEWAFSKTVIEEYSYGVRACSNTNGCSFWSTTKTVDVTGGIVQPAQLGNTGDVGTTPYGFDVATDGDLVASVPIHVIPGVAGFAPSLSLEYDSGRGIDQIEQSLPDDSIGYGWRLAGLSEIRRCVVGQASTTSIQLNSNDSLCLDGMPLVLESGTHFVVGATYRTLIESYIKIELKESTGSLWFEATLPDGTVRQYGAGNGSRVDQNGGTDYLWSVVQDMSIDGNTVDYTYWHDPSRGINRILFIDYTDARIDFEYLERTDTHGVAIGSATQTQNTFLHTIKVSYSGTAVREYRLLDEVVGGLRRFNQFQHCGFDEDGTNETCLAPLDFDWLTPSSTMSGVPILMDGLSDGLGAVHQFEYGTITGGSHTFLFTERPFGNGSLPSDTQLLSGSGALRHVATRLRRDNGLGGSHDTSFAYQNVGVESTKHWGFLGFYTQRITDEQSDIVTYAQYRLDYPYFGQVARLHQLDDVYGPATETLTRIENDYDQESISHGSTSSVLPYASSSIQFIFEGTSQLGASQTVHDLTLSSGFLDQIVTTSETGTSVTEGSSGSTWGDIPTYTIGGLLNTRESTVDFSQRTTAGQWLIDFPEAITVESWPGIASGVGIVQDVTLTAETDTNRPATITRFPNDTHLTLTTTLNYDSAGRLTSRNLIGDNVGTRTTSYSNFANNRYPGQVTNPKGHATTYSDFDIRFGTIESRGDPNNQTTEWDRDPFGRVISHTNSDDIETTTSYNDCPTGCGITVYGIAPAFYVQRYSSITPIHRTYFDRLGRVIREEVQSFDGTSYSKRDFKFDLQGRIEKYSLPYFSGTANSVELGYDLRDRIDNVLRPDGSSTATNYSVNLTDSHVVVTVTDYVKKADGTSDGTQVKRSEYNILGELKKTTDGYGTSTDPVTTYTFDANSSLLTATVDDGVTSITTTFENDAAGNQTKIIGPNIGTVTKTYTALNQIRTMMDNKSQTTTYIFEKLGRIFSVTNADGVSNWNWDTAANGIGKLASRSNSGFSETFSYFSDGRLKDVVTNITPIGSSTGTNYTTSHTYDSSGRPATTTYPGGFVLTRVYNAQGYMSQLKDGATAVHTINDMDAFGNSVDESYGNGVDTLRVYDPETGRLTAVDTTYGSTVFQDNEYAWRSNGTLESRLARPATGLISTREETFGYDVLNRVTLAETFINSSNTRDLEYDYDLFGNIEEKTSTLTGDVDVAGYNYGAGSAGPHAVTSATVAGTLYTLSYDDNGAVTQYDIAGTSDDKYLAYNVFNQPTKIVIGDSIDDTTPVAVDEFAYGPGGQRYARRTKWQDGANTITEEVVYVGAVEIISDDADPNLTTITKTQLSPNVMHVKMQGTNTVEFFEYAHRDHLGSIEVVTDDNGNVLDQLAFEPFGSRKKKDWTANISSTERDDLLDLDWDHARKARGFTRHEHLDRTGFIHMNGRVYDAVLGRFISPDPIVQSPEHSQSWNRHAYVWNSSTSFVDPSGFSKWQDVTERMKEAIDGFASVPLTFYGGGIFADDKVVEQGIPHIGGESITSSTDFAGLDYTIDGCGGISPYCVGVGGLGNDPASKRLRQQEAYRQSMAVMYAWRVARDDEQQMWIDVIEAQVSAPFIAEIPVLLSRAGWRYLASGSAPSLNALPGPRQIAAAWGAGIYRHGGLMTGIEHIMYRHGYNAAFKGVSRFAEGTRLRDISNYVDLALRYGKVTLTRPGTYEVVHDLGRIIGTSQGGTATSILKVFVQDGIIRTAFPF